MTETWAAVDEGRADLEAYRRALDEWSAAHTEQYRRAGPPRPTIEPPPDRRPVLLCPECRQPVDPRRETADLFGGAPHRVAPSPCLRRVRALEESGLITGYRALVDAKALGLNLMALIHISMDQHTPERFEGLETAVKDIPEILECLLITGQSADYQLKVVVRDMDAYQDLLLNRITRIPGVTGVHSSFVLRKVVDRTAVPVGA